MMFLLVVFLVLVEGVAGKKMSKVYEAKVGMILLKIVDKEFVEVAETLENDMKGESEYYHRMVKYQNELFDHIKSLTDVKNISRISDVVVEHFEPFMDYSGVTNKGTEDDDGDACYYMQQSSSFIRFDVFIPRSRREYDIDIRYEKSVAEDFHILYNGMFFVAYVEREEGVSTESFGQAARDFLKSKLTSKKWITVYKPPCPLQLDFIVEESEAANFPESISKDGYSVTVGLPKDIDIDLYFDYFISKIGFDLEDFLSLKSLESRVTWTIISLDDDYEEITNAYTKYINTNPFNFVGRFAVMRFVQTLYVEMLKKSSNISALTHSLVERKKRLKFGSGSEYKKVMYEYYWDMFDCFRPIKGVMGAAKDVNDAVTAGLTQYYTVFAALFGGVVGYFMSKIPDIFKFLKSLLSGIN